MEGSSLFSSPKICDLYFLTARELFFSCSLDVIGQVCINQLDTTELVDCPTTSVSIQSFTVGSMAAGPIWRTDYLCFLFGGAENGFFHTPIEEATLGAGVLNKVSKLIDASEQGIAYAFSTKQNCSGVTMRNERVSSSHVPLDRRFKINFILRLTSRA